MAKARIIARLDIKGPNLIKGMQFEGVRVVGDPYKTAVEYYSQGIDELLYVDSVASLYSRNSLRELVERTIEHTFVPVTVGGGIRSLTDVENLLRSGADKVAVNSAAVTNPQLLKEIAQRFGSQCLVLSVQAKQDPFLGWEAMFHCGREHSGRSVVDWVQESESLGVGEILITSVDRDGTRNGMDLELISTISDVVSVPIIASGGFCRSTDFCEAIKAGASATAIGTALHFRNISIAEIRSAALSMNIPIRNLGF